MKKKKHREGDVGAQKGVNGYRVDLEIGDCASRKCWTTLIHFFLICVNLFIIY